MEYNTQRGKMFIREYGRNIQKLIEYTTTIKDKKKRNAIAKALVVLMGQLKPNMKNIEEYNHKLWDHMIMISDYKLKVDSPFPPPKKKDKIKTSPIPYPKNNIKYKHYGKNVEYLVDKAVSIKDKDKQLQFAELIGSYMKLVHSVKSKENTTDEIIRNDILNLSNGKIKLSEQANFNMLIKASKRKPNTRIQTRYKPYKKKNRNNY